MLGVFSDAIVVVAAFAAGAIASVSGFGIGSILTPILVLMIDTRVAIAAVTIPHLLGSGVRLVLLRVAPDWSVVWTFGMASAGGALLGAVIQPLVASQALALLLGVVLVVVAISELAGLMSRVRFEGPAAVGAGMMSGLLGGLVGNQGGVRSAALLGFNLEKKEVFVATATFVALMIDVVRLPIYLGYYAEHLSPLRTLIVLASGAVLLGTFVGNRLLRDMPDSLFRPIVALILALLGASMIARGLG
jgi:uncharacterized membrane protein YfcA